MRVDEVWQHQRKWSALATSTSRALNRWRLTNLLLLLVGAVLGALAVQDGWLPSPATAPVGALSAAVLAIASFIQVSFLNGARVRERLVTRSVSEGLKGVVFQYLAGVPPFADQDRDERLAASIRDVHRLAGDQQGLVIGVAADRQPLPGVHGIEDYVRLRAIGQRDWHEARTREHRRSARLWRAAELAATALAVVLAAIGSALEGPDLSSWIAVATTAAAAVAAHLAGQQHDRIAESYARTVMALDSLNSGMDPARATPQRAAHYVASVERVLAAQNESWVSLFGATV